MPGSFQHRTGVIAGAALMALIGWKLLPGTELDRAAFSIAARSFANPPFFIKGFGSRETPWNLRTFSSVTRSDSRQAPLIVSLGDDPQGVFQSSPPSPVDLAVILKNFQRLGVKKAATAAVLAWDKPDPMGLAALDLAIGRFESLVMAAPLSRGAVPEPMPPSFRKTSVPVGSVLGDTSLLPVVNRIPLNGVILGGKNTSAGFQVLDSEPATGRAPLLARWEDRVVFAFPVVVMLQRLDLPVDQLEIHPGGFLKFGKSGPIIPIDTYGRLDAPVKYQRPYSVVSAEELIDGNDGLFPKQAPDPAILRDDRSGSEPGTRAFSASLPSVIAAIAADAGLAMARDYPRPRAIWEFLMLGVLCIGIWWISGMAKSPCRIALAILGGLIVTLQVIGIGMAGIWLPGLAALAAVCTSLVGSYFRSQSPALAETRSQTAFPETSSPPVEDSSPPVEDSSPSLEDSSPSLEDSSPSLEDSSPSLEDSSPSLEDSSPPVEDSSPSMQDSSPLLEPPAKPKRAPRQKASEKPAERKPTAKKTPARKAPAKKAAKKNGKRSE